MVKQLAKIGQLDLNIINGELYIILMIMLKNFRSNDEYSKKISQDWKLGEVDWGNASAIKRKCDQLVAQDKNVSSPRYYWNIIKRLDYPIDSKTETTVENYLKKGHKYDLKNISSL